MALQAFVGQPPPNTPRAAAIVRCCPARPDKYETAQVAAFVQQLLAHGGYYDEHLDFVRVERVQVQG